MSITTYGLFFKWPEIEEVRVNHAVFGRINARCQSFRSILKPFAVRKLHALRVKIDKRMGSRFHSPLLQQMSLRVSGEVRYVCRNGSCHPNCEESEHARLELIKSQIYRDLEHSPHPHTPTPLQTSTHQGTTRVLYLQSDPDCSIH